jgi:hypothetical protein
MKSASTSTQFNGEFRMKEAGWTPRSPGPTFCDDLFPSAFPQEVLMTEVVIATRRAVSAFQRRLASLPRLLAKSRNHPGARAHVGQGGFEVIMGRCSAPPAKARTLPANSGDRRHPPR